MALALSEESSISDEPDLNWAEAQARDDRNAAAVIHAYGDLAHDFRNLLLAAQSSLELIRMRITEPKQCALADRGLEALDRAGALIERLRALSCRHEPQPPRFDLSELVHDLVPALQRLAAGIMLRAKRVAGPMLVAIDPEQITLMLVNLVLNARDASPAGGAVQIGLRRVETDGKPYAELSVADRGTGMDRVTAARALEPYFSGPEHGGRNTGLGLSQVYALAQRCGGSLTIDSDAGRGTIVRIQLPIAAPLP